VVELGQTSAAEGTGERTELITLERVLIFNIFFFSDGICFFLFVMILCVQDHWGSVDHYRIVPGPMGQK